MTDLNKNEVKADPNVEPVKIKEEDIPALQKMQSQVDTLSRYRQEMGRLMQQVGNLREEANKVELELAETRRDLADRYGLLSLGMGQWALDFETREFVKTAPGTPVIP